MEEGKRKRWSGKLLPVEEELIKLAVPEGESRESRRSEVLAGSGEKTYCWRFAYLLRFGGMGGG